MQGIDTVLAILLTQYRGSRAIREAKSEPELEAQLAMVAIELGKFDEAERLYIQCGRYDLLNKLAQAKGDWKKAIQIATVSETISLDRKLHNLGA